jgi:hypothetical protein
MLGRERHISWRGAILHEVVRGLARAGSEAMDGAQEIGQPRQQRLFPWLIGPANTLRPAVSASLDP